MVQLSQVEIVSECCSYPLTGGRCSSCWEAVVGVPLLPDDMSPVDREILMREYYEKEGLDFDDKSPTEMEPDECKE